MVGSQQTIVWGKNVSITLGSSAYAEADELRLVRSYRILEEEVVGTFVPAFGTGMWGGEIQLGVLYSTDNDFITLTTPASNGDLPITTLTWTLTDTNTTPATKTATAAARLNETDYQWRKGQFVMAQVRGKLAPNTSGGFDVRIS